MRALFCDALAEFAAAGREINAMLEAGLFWEAMAKSQEATVTVNATIATLTELWKEQCMEETGLSVDAIIRECPDGGAFLDISYDD